MAEDYIKLDLENLENEHLCCAIAGKSHKHYQGVLNKKEWLEQQIPNGHVFKKLNERGKVFIEYGDIEDAFVPVVGENYLYIYCFWVSGKFKDKGYGKKLLESAIADGKERGKNGICAIVGGTKKLPYLSDKKFLEKYGFKTVDNASPNFELMALSFDDNYDDSLTPKFTDKSKLNKIDDEGLTVYYTNQCPFTNNTLKEIEEYCNEKEIKLTLIHVDTAQKAKNLPIILNSFAVLYNGEYLTHELLTKSKLDKLLK
ncbi:MAG: GNAT family N-acetyltransferase [Methanobrevibacter sp.]|jgi:ribosomal protein S18 acetylase RimI-like enzyme|nr:GNAT family N-acetyltransferase [Candidatus Methanoflexus mossambicus]